MSEQDIVQKVANGGYCVGCGACALHTDSIQMRLDKYGQMIPVVDASHPLTNEENALIARTCPFSGEGENEDQIGQRLFDGMPKHHEIGHFQSIYAGRVKDNEFYMNGSSGGIGKWLLSKLMQDDLVDYVIQVSEAETCAQTDKEAGSDSQEAHYQYRVFSSLSDVINGSKSAYYPVELSQVLSYVRENEGRYAITGVPCFIKTVRRLQTVETVFAERVAFTLSIVCGHLKTKAYAEMIGWQLGVEPEDLAALDFRKKIPGKKANQKGVQAKSQMGELSREDVVQNVFGTNYGHGLFKYSACDYCDDIVGETADVSVGDAWLPEFLGQGTSLTIIRNSKIQELIDNHNQELQVTEITSQQAADSQRAGIRHRRDYLQYRIWVKKASGTWFPEKRVEPQKSHLSILSRKLVKERVETARLSHDAFLVAKQQKDLKPFKRLLKPHMELMHDLKQNIPAFLLVRLLRIMKVYDLIAAVKKKFVSR